MGLAIIPPGSRILEVSEYIAVNMYFTSKLFIFTYIVKYALSYVNIILCNEIVYSSRFI